MTSEQIEEAIKHLAGKEDVASVRTEIATVRTEIETLRAEMHREIASQLKWMIALQLPTWLGIIGLFLHK